MPIHHNPAAKRKKVENAADEYLRERGLKLPTKITFVDPALLAKYGGVLPKRMMTKPRSPSIRRPLPS